MTTNVLLICTVGGTPAPIAAAIKECKPDRIVFISSRQTQAEIATQIVPLLAKDDIVLVPAQYDEVTVPDSQDFLSCIEKMHGIEPQVNKWISRGSDFHVIVDITGGTKCMSAALALVARRWTCDFSYIGGTERSKGGIGVVIDGKEIVYHRQNPWDALGYQTAEEAIILFDKGDYQGAVDVLASDITRFNSAVVKSELNALILMAEGYLAWDLFDHKKAENRLSDAEKNINNICRLINDTDQNLKDTIRQHLVFLKDFKGDWGRHTIVDLCANARRCANRGRYDDAVARLYRVIEATAQLQLRERHKIPNAANVPFEIVPEPIRSNWMARVKNGFLMLSLQDDYQLLDALGDELAHRFSDLGLAGSKSPLVNRNHSILAHGFNPLNRKVFESLYEKTTSLAQINEDELPQFPALGLAHL